ncbi:MAG: tRNA pseudouridine(55) synthase TruB, partial [Butyrivibrio sp.]|nr:tRNA pseudouridine(55) synthase TruB [Butyrivibrio sp.]
MYNGIINVYKEKGFTSHDVVAKLRGIFGQKKIGHTGTLDPDATGVLPVCLGSGTKLCDMLTDRSKEYEAVLLLGVATDTEDISGKVLERREVSVSENEIRDIIMSFKGEYDQIPPMYSAIKINGKKLYELARAGLEAERMPRHVAIDFLEITDIELPRVRFRVGCSKGTYIRSLCRDIGEAAGCFGCMEDLVRTRVGGFLSEEAHTLSQISAAVEDGAADKMIIPVDACFEEYPAIAVSDRAAALVGNGNMFFDG